MIRNRIQGLTACCFSVFLSACGGGGGATATPVVEITEFPVDASFSAFFSRAGINTASAKDLAGNSYTLTYQIAPGADKSLPGSSAPSPLKTVAVTASVRINAGAPVSSSSEIYFSMSPFKLWGIDGANFEKQSHQLDAAPVAASVGSFGNLASGYLTRPDGFFLDPYSRNISWALERDTATTAWLCIDTQIATASPGREKDCARIDARGNVSGFKSMVVANNIVLNFQ